MDTEGPRHWACLQADTKKKFVRQGQESSNNITRSIPAYMSGWSRVWIRMCACRFPLCDAAYVQPGKVQLRAHIRGSPSGHISHEVRQGTSHTSCSRSHHDVTITTRTSIVTRDHPVHNCRKQAHDSQQQTCTGVHWYGSDCAPPCRGVSQRHRCSHRKGI